MRQTIKEVIFLPSFYYIDKLRASALVQLDNKCQHVHVAVPPQAHNHREQYHTEY